MFEALSWILILTPPYPTNTYIYRVTITLRMHGGKKQKPKEKNLLFIYLFFFLGDNSIVEGDVDILRLQITSTSKLGTTLSSHRLCGHCYCRRSMVGKRDHWFLEVKGIILKQQLLPSRTTSGITHLKKHTQHASKIRGFSLRKFWAFVWDLWKRPPHVRGSTESIWLIK